jgi:MYXO-CTERM domain-containing protein
MLMPKALARTAAALCVLAAARQARATADFPSKVDQHLMLPAGKIASIFPPDGCHLCHVNEIGGDPLTTFGILMKSNGAVKNEDATVGPALDAIQMQDPQLIADLTMGKDPNLDMMQPTLSTDPVPGYGCLSVTPHGPARLAGPLLLAGLGLSVARRRRRAR